MTKDEMRQIVMSFPGVEEGMSYGSPAYKVRGKFFTRLRKDDNSLVLLDIPHDERDMLMEAAPETFHTTPHYKDYPSVLARIETLHPGSLKNFLERRWKGLVTRKQAKEYDEAKNAA
ncbi:MAG: MmcQ/YjbR family DNA-binding protein [Caulobacteraceae bacterium]